MCQPRLSDTPTGGIPIPWEIHAQFPQEVKDAWDRFHRWLTNQEAPIRRDSMPPDIQVAYKIMGDAPIPEHNGLFGRDSCYVRGVEESLI